MAVVEFIDNNCTGTYTNDTWTYWCTTSSNSATTTTGDIWYYWNTSNDYSITTSTTNTVWVKWNNSWEINDGAEERSVVRVEPETPEQLAARAEEHRRYQERLERETAELQRKAAEQAKLAEEAEARAAELLKITLTPEQLSEFEKNRTFTVISKDGERRYRINKGWSHNVERIDKDGKRLGTLCAHPVEFVPHHDNLLAQKLMLENAEDQFLKIANKGAA